MLANATRIREHIESRTFIEFRLDDGTDSTAENVDLLAPYYSLFPDKPNAKAVVIAFSNRQALQYNTAIRRHYFGDGAPRLKTGDLLIIARNNYANGVELFNGNIVQVEAVQPDNEVETHSVKLSVGNGRKETVKLLFRGATICFKSNNGPVSLPIKLLDNFLDSPDGSIGGLLARALNADFIRRLPEEIRRQLPQIRRLNQSEKDLDGELQELRDKYARLLQHDPYYNAVICKYGYAITCHKAQGGEWDNVFVDMCRYGGTANENYFRWAYTALTRASNKIWHFRSPDFNYISNITVEEIQPSANIKVSVYTDDGDFCSARFSRISEFCKMQGIHVSDNRSKQYQHIVSFSNDSGEFATFQLWYNAKGYNGKEIPIGASSSDFVSSCSAILEDSFAPLEVPYSAPDRPFAEKLASFLLSQLEETGIQLLDITQDGYQDVFHIKTDGLAQIRFYHTDKGNYTYMKLLSSLGKNDTKLQALRQRFT